MAADIEGNDGGFLFGGKHGFGIFNRSTAQYRYIKKAWNGEEIVDGKDKTMRANDGAVDSKGRLWVRYMNDPLVKEPVDEGILSQLTGSRSVSIPNT